MCFVMEMRLTNNTLPLQNISPNQYRRIGQDIFQGNLIYIEWILFFDPIVFDKN